MKKILLFIFILFILLIPFYSYAGTYWVDDDGTETTWANCQNASPMSGSSCCTVATANTNAAAADTVYFRTGTYTFNGANGIDPTNTGTSGNPITFSSYNSEVVTFNNINAGVLIYAVDLNSDYGTVRSYIKIHGITFTNFNRHLWILKGDYNEISSCSFTSHAAAASALGWRASTIYRDADYNWIHDCTFGEYGYFGSGAGDNDGVIFELGNEAAGADDDTAYNIIEDCHLYHAGHHVFGMNGNHNVIRNNYIHNEPWFDYLGTDYGYRCTFMVGNDGYDERNLLEGNRIAYASGPPGNQIGGSGGTVASRYHIIRYNMYYQNGIYGFIVKEYSGQGEGDYNRIYNNTFWHNGYTTTENLKSNWHDDYTHAMIIGEDFYGAWNNVAVNNIFYDHQNLVNANNSIIDLDNNPPTDNNTLTNNWEGTVDGDPLFTSISGTPDPNNETQFDFTLQSTSGCIDNGTYLTQANGSGSSTITLIVDDAKYFQDGFGNGAGANENASVAADYIAIGTVSNTVQISSINYGTNTIILASAKSWSDNANIWLYKDSDGTVVLKGAAPDQGAHEAAGVGAASGTISPGGCTEGNVVDGGRTIVIDLVNAVLVAAGATFDAQRQNILDGITAATSPANGWNAEWRDKEAVTAVVRTDSNTITVTMSSQAAISGTFDIATEQIVTVTIPTTATEEAVEIVCTPTFTISAEQIGAETISGVYHSTGPGWAYDATGPSVVAP